MKNKWNYKPCQFSVHHKTAYKSAEIMPNLAGWRACLLVLLVLMVLLLKPYMALVALYCCIVALYSFILAPLKRYIAAKLHEKHMELQTLSVQCSPQDSL